MLGREPGSSDGKCPAVSTLPRSPNWAGAQKAGLLDLAGATGSASAPGALRSLSATIPRACEAPSAGPISSGSPWRGPDLSTGPTTKSGNSQQVRGRGQVDFGTTMRHRDPCGWSGIQHKACLHLPFGSGGSSGVDGAGAIPF